MIWQSLWASCSPTSSRAAAGTSARLRQRRVRSDVAVEIGGQEGAKGGAGRGDFGGDVQGGRVLVAVLEELARRRRHRRDLGHRVAVEQPAAVRLPAQADPSAVRAGQGVDVAGDFFGDALGVDVRGAENFFQLDGEQIGVAPVGRRAAQVQAGGPFSDVLRILVGGVDRREQGLNGLAG